ncbi:MAG: VWA domain-containing protein, partial [Chloroflexota bacterium]|nr:VWA domain-containing protein [Chloroflexota bacterium]
DRGGTRWVEEHPPDPTSDGQILPSPRELPSREFGSALGRMTSERAARVGDDEATTQELARAYSAWEALRAKDFASFTSEESSQARELMRSMTWRVGERQSRRTVAARRGASVDIRRSLRRLMRSGELLELSRREHKTKRRPLVVICDISGSMDRYSRLLLQFLHTVEHGESPVEVFVFGTRLTRITWQLRTRNIDAALDSVAQEVQDWSGGTRIGESLRTFNTLWSRRMLRRGAVVLVISDGWDRGDPAVISREMAKLQRSSHRLIWLNPLLGSPTYQPLTHGIRAALPYVDDFLPVHNLNSLEALAAKLGSVPARRPVRRQSTQLPPG